MASTKTAHTVTTLGGIQMPKLIYGTAWKKESTTDLVVKAITLGFRGIDTVLATLERKPFSCALLLCPGMSAKALRGGSRGKSNAHCS